MQWCPSALAGNKTADAEAEATGRFGRRYLAQEANDTTITTADFEYELEFSSVGTVQTIASLVSLVGCAFIILSYVIFPPLRRYHSSFVIWIALMGILFHGSSVTQQSQEFGECCVTAAITQISLLGQEFYFFVLAFNFYYTTKYPFHSTAYLVPFYHAFIWVVVGATAYIGSYRTGGAINSYGFCWFGAFKTPGAENTLLFTFMLPLAVGHCVCTGWYLIATKRVRLGFGGFHAKDSSTNLDTMRNYLVWSFFYWAVIFVPWVLRHKEYVVMNSPEEKMLRFAGRMTIALKGLLVAVVWARIMNMGSAYQVWKRGTWDEYMKVHEAPWVLRRQILYFATKGIQYSASLTAEQSELVNCGGADNSHRSAGSSVSRGSMSILHNPWRSHPEDCHDGGGPAVVSYELEGPTPASKAIFRDFHPSSFQEIRRLSGITSDSYIQSFAGRTKERFSEGKSGSFLYYTGDQLFILKTCTPAEQRYLLQILPQYMAHIRDNPNSYLCRYVGCHELVMEHHSVTFIVLTNILNNTAMNVDEFYDLKGSWVGRFRALTQKGTKRVCKYCGRDYIVGMSKEGCERNPTFGRGHSEMIVGKDINWGNRQLRLPEELVQQLGSQLYADSEFLRRMNSMDYSLIIGMSRYPSFTLACSDDAGVDDWKFSSVDKNSTELPGEEDAARPPSFLDTTYAQAASPVAMVSQSRDGFSTEACVVSMGIIDILTPWSLRKSMEHWMRVYFQCRDQSGISCVNPTVYADRFRKNVIDVVIFGQGKHKGRYEPRGMRGRRKEFIMVDFANTQTGTPIVLLPPIEG